MPRIKNSSEFSQNNGLLGQETSNFKGRNWSIYRAAVRVIQDAWKSHIKAAHKSITILMKSRENKDNTKFVNYWGWSRRSEKLKNEALLLICSFSNRIREHAPKTCIHILKRKKEIKTKFQSPPHSILVQSYLIYSNSLDTDNYLPCSKFNIWWLS